MRVKVISKLDHIETIGGMERPKEYSAVVVETYSGIKPGKSSRVHVRPVAGQDDFNSAVDVECCRDMRKNIQSELSF